MKDANNSVIKQSLMVQNKLRKAIDESHLI